MMSEANRCRFAGMLPETAERHIAEHITRPPSPANEIQSAVKKAYSTSTWTPSRTATPFTPKYLAPVPITDIAFDLAKLRASAERITQPKSWRHWLWERSPKRPETQNAYSFLAHLYRDGEKVHVFDKFDGIEGATPNRTITISQPMDCRVPSIIRDGGRFDLGIWYLANPVSGEWYDTGEKRKDGSPKFSCRNWQAITSWRYAVLESDQAPAHLWLAFVAQLPIRISAIYTSGGRSIHVLLRLDAQSKREWDEQIVPLKRPMKVLGGDHGALSAVRLTRLPGCSRPEKNGFQKLLYLCPNPPDVPLMDLPILRTRLEMLDRWRNLCPRWNKNQEAFQ